MCFIHTQVLKSLLQVQSLHSTGNASFYLLGRKLGLVSGKMTEAQAREFVENLQEVPNLIESVITQAPDIEQLTKRMVNATNAFFIGRGLDYTLCMEGHSSSRKFHIFMLRLMRQASLSTELSHLSAREFLLSQLLP